MNDARNAVDGLIREKDLHLSPLMMVFSTLFSTLMLFLLYKSYRSNWFFFSLLDSWDDSWLIRIPLTFIVWFLLGGATLLIVAAMGFDSWENRHLFIRTKNMEFESTLTKLNKKPLMGVLSLLLILNILVLMGWALVFTGAAIGTLFHSFDLGKLAMLGLAAIMLMGGSYLAIFFFKNGEKQYFNNLERFTTSLELNAFETSMIDAFRLLKSELSLGNIVSAIYAKLPMTDPRMLLMYLKESDFGGLFRNLIGMIVTLVVRALLFILRPIFGAVKAKYFYYLLYPFAAVILLFVYLLSRVIYLVVTLLSSVVFYGLILFFTLFALGVAASVLVINAPFVEWFYHVGSFDFWPVLYILLFFAVLNIFWGLMVWSFNYEFDGYYNPAHLYRTVKHFLGQSSAAARGIFVVTLVIGVWSVGSFLKYAYDTVPKENLMAQYQELRSLYIYNTLAFLSEKTNFDSVVKQNKLSIRMDHHAQVVEEALETQRGHPITFDLLKTETARQSLALTNDAATYLLNAADSGMRWVDEVMPTDNRPEHIHADKEMSFAEAEKYCQTKGYRLLDVDELMEVMEAKKQTPREGWYWSSSKLAKTTNLYAVHWSSLQINQTPSKEKLFAWCVLD